MSEKSIWDALRAAGLSEAGTAALMGNLKAESLLISNIAQRGMTSLSDEAYTAAADAGSIPFATDSVGYGLAQWTYSARKANLLAYARSLGVSVGTEAMQVQFAVQELREDYNSLYAYLKTAKDLYEATCRVCSEYERPAVNNYSTRYQHARQIYNANALGSTSEQTGTQTTAAASTGPITLSRSKSGKAYSDAVKALQALLTYHGYKTDADGWFGPGTETALKAFQGSNKLDPDGICGQATWSALVN